MANSIIRKKQGCKVNEMEVLRRLVAVGADACNVEVSRALTLLDRLTGTTKPNQNKTLFYQLCALLGQGEATKYTTPRANKLRLRLKTYSIEELVRAAKAIAADDYMMGASGRKYGTIDYLLRSDEQIDTWIENAAAVKQVINKAENRYKVNPIAPAPSISDEQRAANLETIARMREKLNKNRTK